MTKKTKTTSLAIDLETYSSVDIKFGVYRYVDAPDFQILLMAYCFDGEEVVCVDLTKEEVPDRVRRALFDTEITKTAFNAAFEINCLRTLYPDMPVDCWECTSVLALYNSLPASLGKVAKALGFSEDKKKDARGAALIRYFSKPCKPTKANGGRTRNLPEHAPEKWAEFQDYCRQDVVVEMAIRKRLGLLAPSPIEHEYWLMDQRINAAGTAIDTQMVDAVLKINAKHQEMLLAEAGEITGLENPNSIAQLKTWLEKRLNKTIPGLTKADVTELLAENPAEDVQRVLQIRQMLGKSSIKKYQTMKAAVTKEGRCHGMFQFYGASRTGRWAGRIVQLHNLPRNYLEGDGLDTAREIVKTGDVELLAMCYDNVPDILSQLIRTALVAEKGSRFIVADYSAIEARVIAWMAGESWRQAVFADTGKIYEASAAQMFHVPVETIVHGHENYALRQKGKVAELALGYGGGPAALIAMGALSMGIPEEDLPDMVTRWRKASPKIVRFWYDVDSAAKRALRERVPVRIRQDVTFRVAHGAMFIELPSGRHLVYTRPTFGQDRWGRESIMYTGVNQTSGKWEQLETYGGKLVENIVQAVARDCLAAAMLRLDKAGYKIVMHIHDEVVIEAPEGEGSLADVIGIMRQKESWNQGLITNAAGFETKYYMKD